MSFSRNCLLLLAWLILPLSAATEPAFTLPATNVRGAEFPRILPDLRVTLRIEAPEAKTVRFDLGKRYEATRDDRGGWTATTDPQVPGFHYYSVEIDGAPLNDPASESFFGGGRQCSGLEIPEAGVDFHQPKNVPHGEVRERSYFSKTTNSWRRIFVYTPPGYDADTTTRYPVLYLQHGSGEDERGWVAQGRVSHIMDNLIAEKSTRPMLIVMENGHARRPGETGESNNPSGTLNEVFIQDLIPMIDSTYRTLTDRDHRAMAGHSTGGVRSFTIALANLDKFSHIGGFSGAGCGAATFDPTSSHNGVMADADDFNSKVRLVWLGTGAAGDGEPHQNVRDYRDSLEKAGIGAVYYESPGTAHEWRTWRRCLREFAPLLFQPQPLLPSES